MDTYITLSVLLVSGIWFTVWLIKQHYNHEKKSIKTFDYPLDNKGKWWYN